MTMEQETKKTKTKYGTAPKCDACGRKHYTYTPNLCRGIIKPGSYPVMIVNVNDPDIIYLGSSLASCAHFANELPITAWFAMDAHRPTRKGWLFLKYPGEFPATLAPEQFDPEDTHPINREGEHVKYLGCPPRVGDNLQDVLGKYNELNAYDVLLNIARGVLVWDYNVGN